MDNHRRKFIRLASAAAAGGALLPHIACKQAEKVSTEAKKVADVVTSAGTPSLDKFGIQLYTLRDIIGDDPTGTISKLSDMGYRQIEGYEGDQGMFWNMPHKDFKSFLDDSGLSMISSHCNINDDFEQKVEQAAEVGMEYLICPYIGPQKSMDAWKVVTEKFNKCGEICKAGGIKFAYHNHAYTFVAFSGMIPHDFLMDNTDPDLVDHQMDIYWVVTGGADPVEYLTKYKNRFKLCHVKDRMKGAPADEHSASCDLGTGTIDYPKILKIAADNGMKHYILEQERYDNSTPLKSAKAGADYLSKLTFA